MMSFQFKVGRLLCREVREYLQREKFKGRRIEFMESSGWIERIFVVRGEPTDLNPIIADLKRYAERLASQPNGDRNG